MVNCPACNGTGKAQISSEHRQKERDRKIDAAAILWHLDKLMDKRYHRSQANHDLVIQRLKQGATRELCIKVIDYKFKDWEWSDMIKYLRPLTLFGKQKFSQYSGECE
jgi:uncharacterized phage protein (TIGR02220 family)